MKRSNFLGKEINSGWRNVTAQERVNCYLEITPQGEKQKVVAYGTPGLTTFCDLGAFPVRGGISANDAIYCVVHSFFYKVDNAGTATQIGSISTDSGFVSMSSNGLQILISDGSLSGYIYTFSTGLLTLITDADYPAIRTNCFVDGYFVGNEINTGKYYISGLYDGTSWNALDFASAESNPDYIEAVWAEHGGVMLLGTYSTEIVGNNGAQDFPFARIGYPIEWGLLALKSVARLGDHTCFVARNRMGEAQVVLLSGYNPQKVSTPDIESLLSDADALESATAFSYMMNGHQFYQLNTKERSYLYDITSGFWSTVQSYGVDRHRAEMSFNLVNRIIVSDYENGKLYTLRDDVYTDNGDPIIMDIVGQVAFNKFDRMSVHELQVDCEVGDGCTIVDSVTNTRSDPYWDNVVLLLDFNDANGTSSFNCQKTGRIFNTSGSFITSNALPDGSYNSGQSGGTGDYCYATPDLSFCMGTDSFTVDAKIYLTANAQPFVIFDTAELGTGGASGNRSTGFALYISSGVPTVFFASSAWTFGAGLNVGTAWNYNEWTDVRLTVQQGAINISMNNTWGTQASISYDMNGASYNAGLSICVIGNVPSTAVCSGHIRKLRITKGVVRGSNDYTLSHSQTPYFDQYTTTTTYKQAAPQIMMQTSKDFGHTWGTERWASLGKIGEYLSRVRWSRLGRAYAFTFRLKISDPVRRAIIGIYMRASQ